MSKWIDSKFFCRPQRELSPWQIIHWWESRRIIFNFYVGLTGILACIIMFITGYITEATLGEAIGIPDPPLFGIITAVVYAIGANICYTGGWISELVARRFWPSESSSFGRISFFLGTSGSILLTLVPPLVTVCVAMVEEMEKLFKAH